MHLKSPLGFKEQEIAQSGSIEKKSLLERDEISQNTRANSPIGARGNWELESCQKAKICLSMWHSLCASTSSPPLPEPAISVHSICSWPQLYNMASRPRDRHQWAMVSM